MKQYFQALSVIMAIILFLALSSSLQAQNRVLRVAVIAPSVSTSVEAREVLAKNGWSETSLRDADGVLVVVRSMLYNPLNYSYRSVSDLQRDADTQLNISGDNFHVYLYQMNNDLSVRQLKHASYKARN